MNRDVISMKLLLECFCECTIPEIYKILPKDTSLVITSNKNGTSALIEEHCQKNKIPILIIKPNNEENVSDTLIYLNLVATLADEFIFITEKDSNDARVYIEFAKQRKKRANQIYNS